MLFYFLKLSLPLFFFFLSGPYVHAGFEQNVSDTELTKHGLEIYKNRCQGCHGEKGDGLGPASVFLDPRPRDFTKGVFKFTSTPNGSLPSDQDLMRTLAQGVLGTSMPSFLELPEMSRFALILYIKSFSDVWKKTGTKMAAIHGSPFPMEEFQSSDKFLEKAKLGRKSFIENCVVCHGAEGKGNGEGAEGLVDEWQNVIRPADLTKPFIKSGKSVRDIYRVLLSGVGGTPMPSFKDVIPDNELWDVAAYILYLRGEGAGLYGGEVPIPKITKEELP